MNRVILFVVLILSVLSCSKSGDEDANAILKPEIVSGPFDAIVFEGSSAAFSVSATGADLQYQWYKNGVADGSEAGKKAQYIVLSGSAKTGDLFYCVVTNPAGNVSSSSAELKVIPSPVIERVGGMVKIPVEDGPFACGSVSDMAVGNEWPVHQVTLTKSFFMDTIPVSEAAFSKIMKKYCPITHPAMPWGTTLSTKRPAVKVSWDDAVLYCNAKSREDGFDTAYVYNLQIDVDGKGTVLDLSDSVLQYNRNGVDTAVDVRVLDSIVIVPEDTVDTKQNVTFVVNNGDTTYSGRILRTVFPAETISIASIVGYSLVGITKVDTVQHTVVRPDTTVENRIVSSGFFVVDLKTKISGKDTVIQSYDTLKIARDTVVDTVITLKVENDGSPVAVNGYRLPTEAEWEFAARARSGSDYYWGSGSLAENAWYLENSGSSLQVAAQKKPNKFGLYDMLGNVWEWCNDFYGEYSSEGVIDPQGAVQGKRRVQRGGSYVDLPVSIRCSQRGSGLPSARYSEVGFRTVRIAE